MSELQQFTEKLRTHLRKAEIGLCLQEIEKYIKKEPKSSLLNEFIGYSSTLTTLEQEKRINIITPADYYVQNSQLMNNILKAIDLFTDDHFDFTKKLKEEIHEKILVICDSQLELDRITPFFKPEIFKGVEYTTNHDLTLEKAQNYRLIIFANLKDKAESEKFNDTLEKTLKDGVIHPILYFGSYLPALTGYPDKAYFANSKISLLPRIREMLEYARLFPQDFTYYPK